MAAAFQSMEQTGISSAQATAIRNTIFELVSGAITDAGNEAAANLAQQQKSAGGARHWSEQPAEAAGMWSAAPGPASGSSAVRTRTDKLVFDI